jgi:hypothetical protein
LGKVDLQLQLQLQLQKQLQKQKQKQKQKPIRGFFASLRMTRFLWRYDEILGRYDKCCGGSGERQEIWLGVG